MDTAPAPIYVETLHSPVLGTYYAAYPDDRTDYHVLHGHIGCGASAAEAIAALKRRHAWALAA